MAKEFYTILTATGKEKLLRATVSNKLEINTFAVGDGQGRYYEPNEDQVALVNQRYKANVNAVSLEGNQITVECLIPSSVGGFTIRELGIYDKEDTLLLIAKYPATEKPIAGSGSEKDLHIKVVLELDNAENVAITADANVVVATMGNVKKELKKYYNKQEVDEKIEGFNSVEVVDSLESADASKALSANQGKQLKRLIEAVPTIEIVDNLQTNNSQKVLSAAQGVVIAEKLRESGLQIEELESLKGSIQLTTDREFVNSLISNTAKAGSVLLFSNIGERNGNVTGEGYTLYAGLMNCNRYSGCDITVKAINMEEQSLHPMHFQSPNFFIAKVDKQNAKRVVIYPLGGGNVDELSERLDSVEEKANQAFQSARDGKIKLANAITSKGQVVSNTASFETMAQKIREIKTGYSIGDFLSPDKFVHFRIYAEKTHIPSFSVTPFIYLGTVLDGIKPYAIFTKSAGKVFTVGIKKMNYDYPTGYITNVDDLATNDIPYDYLIELTSSTSDNFTMADIIIVGNRAYLHCGKGVHTRYFFVYELVYGSKANLKAETSIPNTGIDACNFFAESICWVITRGRNITTITFRPSNNQYNLVNYNTSNLANRMFLATPLGFYLVEDVEAPSPSGVGSGLKSKVLNFYSYGNLDKVKRSISIHNAKSVVTYTYSLFNKSRINIPHHCFCFVADNSSSPYNRNYIVYALDYINHKLTIISTPPLTSTLIGDGLLLHCRYAIAYLKVSDKNDPTVYLPNANVHESLTEIFQYLGGESLGEDVQHIHVFADKNDRFYFVQKKLNGKEHSYYARGTKEGGLILQ